jgi:hypothetical protein
MNGLVSLRGRRSNLVVSALVPLLLAGCVERSGLGLGPQYFPVFGAPEQIFIDPVGKPYTEVYVHPLPALLGQKLQRDARPIYPSLQRPADGDAPSLTIPPSQTPPGSMPAPATPDGKSGALQVPPGQALAAGQPWRVVAKPVHERAKLPLIGEPAPAADGPEAAVTVGQPATPNEHQSPAGQPAR